MLRLLEEGIPCLPIHDSFIVGISHVEALRKVMAEASEMKTGKPIPVEEKWPILEQLTLQNEAVAPNSGQVMGGGPYLVVS